MVMHHYHTRRRREPFPARTLGLRVLDLVVYVAGIAGPLATLPQIIKIYSTQDAAGVSLVSWSIFALFDIPWIIYAIVHKERPLVVCYTLWLIANITVALGAFLYNGGPGGLL